MLDVASQPHFMSNSGTRRFVSSAADDVSVLVCGHCAGKSLSTRHYTGATVDGGRLPEERSYESAKASSARYA